MKTQLRKQMKELRANLGATERGRIDAAITANLVNLAAYESARVVFTYLSFDDEIDTRALIENAWGAGKTVAIPRCVDGSRVMEWHTITDFGELEPGAYGIEEPPAVAETIIDPRSANPAEAIAIVPALAFDRAGFRLGYGGGYYDTFLPTFPGQAIGLCRDVQLSEQPLPTFETDVAVDLIVTESQTLLV